MRIRYTVSIEDEGHFESIEAFRASNPGATIVLIDGWARMVCPKGHMSINPAFCYECHRETPCEECGIPNATCDCIPF